MAHLTLERVLGLTTCSDTRSKTALTSIPPLPFIVLHKTDVTGAHCAGLEIYRQNNHSLRVTTGGSIISSTCRLLSLFGLGFVTPTAGQIGNTCHTVHHADFTAKEEKKKPSTALSKRRRQSRAKRYCRPASPSSKANLSAAAVTRSIRNSSFSTNAARGETNAEYRIVRRRSFLALR
jgi:hypothetical protein